MADDLKAGLTDMKRSPKVVKKEGLNSVNYKPNPYGYGTSLRLDKQEITKLGIKDLPEVGDEYRVIAVAKVTRVSSSAAEGRDEDTSMELQITHMILAHSDDDKKEPKTETKSEKGKAASVLPERGIGNWK